MPRAVSLAPGLQKHPVRIEMRRSAALDSTVQKSTTAPVGSRRLNGMVPPRSEVVGRAVEAHDRRPVGVSEGGEALEQPVGHRRTCWWIVGIPTASMCRSPISIAGRLR